MPPELKQLLKAAFSLLDAGESPPLDTIRIGDMDFRVLAERHEDQGWIVVLIPEPSLVPCDYTIMERYGLTERQLEVARLLGDRYSDRDIADALGIALSTAERHSERVMRKLDVSRRKDVRAKLLDCCGDD